MSKRVCEGFRQPDYNLLILLGMVIIADFALDDNFNDSFRFRHFPE